MIVDEIWAIIDGVGDPSDLGRDVTACNGIDTVPAGVVLVMTHILHWYSTPERGGGKPELRYSLTAAMTCRKLTLADDDEHCCDRPDVTLVSAWLWHCCCYCWWHCYSRPGMPVTVTWQRTGICCWYWWRGDIVVTTLSPGLTCWWWSTIGGNLLLVFDGCQYCVLVIHYWWYEGNDDDNRRKWRYWWHRNIGGDNEAGLLTVLVLLLKVMPTSIVEICVWYNDDDWWLMIIDDTVMMIDGDVTGIVEMTGKAGIRLWRK